MFHELLEFIEKDKLGAALLLILLSLTGLIPVQVLRMWRSRKGSMRESGSDSGKRLAMLEREREVRTQKAFDKIHDHAGFIQTLQSEVRRLSRELDDMRKRVDSGEQSDDEFRERLLRLELSATAMATDARAARRVLERDKTVQAPEGNI